jgi:hypothetical protein
MGRYWWMPDHVEKGERVYVIKDRFAKGDYTIYLRRYRNGKLSSERVYDTFRRKKDADIVANRLRKTRRP